jgi:hypothetical protein
LDLGNTIDLVGEQSVIQLNLDTKEEPSLQQTVSVRLDLDSSDDGELPQANNVIEEDSLMEETKEFVMYSEGNNNFDFEVEIGSLPPLSINPKYREFIVQNPTKNGSYITYNVVGCTNIDSRLEKFNLFKRYGDFE